MLILKTLSHWVFRVLSTVIGLACLWSIANEPLLVATLFMGTVGFVFLAYGLFRSDLLEDLETVGRVLLSRKYSRKVS